jgi:hypothetical protein
LIEADRLLVTNNSVRFVFSNGTLAVRQLTIANGLFFDVGNGVSPATLISRATARLFFAIMRSSARLIGNGTIVEGYLIRRQALAGQCAGEHRPAGCE